jgi:hypothetical protein
MSPILQNAYTVGLNTVDKGDTSALRLAIREATEGLESVRAMPAKLVTNRDTRFEARVGAPAIRGDAQIRFPYRSDYPGTDALQTNPPTHVIKKGYT